VTAAAARSGGSNVQYALFDLDNTLYPKSAGVMEAVARRISAYMATHLGMDEATIKELRPRYWKQYGTTMRGLWVEHHIDPDDYLWYIHDLPMSDFLTPNVELEQVLAGLPWHKAIFTNSSREHAQQVLAALGIEQQFERVFDMRDTGYFGKPYPAAYLCVLQALGCVAEECLLIDDSPANLRPARELGMTTVLVGLGEVADYADFALARVEDIGRVARRMAHRDARE